MVPGGPVSGDRVIHGPAVVVAGAGVGEEIGVDGAGVGLNDTTGGAVVNAGVAEVLGTIVGVAAGLTEAWSRTTEQPIVTTANARANPTRPNPRTK
jgi:hypothetical protein